MGEWHETGCFVYQILSAIGVRNTPSINDDDRTGKSFSKGELISIDLVRHVSAGLKNDGPFLRLADGSGWLFGRKGGVATMKRMPVEVGLWTFYGDNYPAGIGLRNHPIDQLHNGSKAELHLKPRDVILPMQKVYCDRKVTAENGIHFYRVQGVVNAWVFDRRKKDNGTMSTMLLPESKIRIGLFAYRVLQRLAVRKHPDVSEEAKSSMSIGPDKIVVADAIRESSHDTGHGPFLRLLDGSGWLFEHKSNERMMEKVSIERGQWRLRVVNSVGIWLRKQPIDEFLKYGNQYMKDQEVTCDQKIAYPTGVNFYRVAGTAGWVFDKRGSDTMLEMISSTDNKLLAQPSSGISAWSLDFIRGVATSIDGLHEVSCNAQSHVISFCKNDSIRINVYYTTRTVGTAIDHPHQGKTQLFRRDCSGSELAEIFKNPRIHTGRGYQTKRARLNPSDEYSDLGAEIGAEEDIRSSLMECDQQVQDIMERRTTLLQTIHKHCERRRLYASGMEDRRLAHGQLLEAARQKALKARRKMLTCHHCSREFKNVGSLESHVSSVHETHCCDYCGKACKSSRAINQHKDATGHW